MVADIDTAALIHKLQAFALGSDGNAMSEQQVAAAGALLDRVLPDLHRIDLHAADGQPILVELANTASADDCPIAEKRPKVIAGKASLRFKKSSPKAAAHRMRVVRVTPG